MSGVTAAFVPQRILVVEEDAQLGNQLKADLERVGHVVVAQAASPAEAIETFTQHQPDLILLDIHLEKDIELLGQLAAIRRCPVVVISASSDPQRVQQASSAGVFGYLLKPVTADALAAQITVAVDRFADQERLTREKEALAQNLENRKLIEKAKGILMRLFNLDEPGAHRRLQQESQKRRISIVELSKKIIESEDLLGGS